MTAEASGASPTIKNGIEYFTRRFDWGDEQEEVQCARCGAAVDRVTCWSCSGDGHHGSACWDDLCHGNDECIHGDDEMEPCDECRGEGGSLHCTQTREWCEAHPMVGREQIPSTAFSDMRAWDD
jgi:hypothetical protein